MADLIGREAEQAIVDTFLADSGRHLMLIDGAPGIGKTAFLAAIADTAIARGHRVVSTQPVEVERELSFAGLGDLLSDISPDDLDVLPEPQRVALEVALLLRSPDDTTPAPRAVATAFLNLLRAMSTEMPVLLIVDDAQWLDQATNQTLRFAVRRVGTDSVRLILARRNDTAPELGEWLGHSSVSRLDLGPLTLGATHAVLMSHLESSLKRPELRQIHEWSRGNPLHALELGRAYEQGSIRFEASASVPIGLENLLARRVQQLPEDTRLALSAIASASALSRTELAQVVDFDVDKALAPAEREKVVVVTDGTVEFTHPLLASASYASADAEQLRLIHGRLARIIEDPDEGARHLAHSIVGTDDLVAEKLEHAAASVFHRGSPFLAAGLAQLARERTPDGKDDDRARRALAEAEYRFESGDTIGASNLVVGLVGTTDPGPDRARLLALLARYHHFASGLADSARYLEEARAEAGDDPALRFAIEEGLAWNRLLMRDDLARADAAARNAIEFAEAAGDPGCLAEGLAVAALTTTAGGGDGSATIERALDLETSILHLRVLRHPSFAHASWLTSLDRLGEARSVLAELVQRAETGGDESALPTLLHHIGLVECLRGNHAAALEFAGEAESVAEQDDQIPARISALGRLALTHARIGNPDQTRVVAESALSLACPNGWEVEDIEPILAHGGEVALWSLGLAALLEGDSIETRRLLMPITRVFRAAGYLNPGDIRFLPDTLEALSATTRTDETAELAQWAEEMDSDRPGARGVALWCRGLGAVADGALDLAEDLMGDAVELLSASELAFEHARALLSLGKVQRRARSKSSARSTLSAAEERFARIGSEGWAAIARLEGDRIGAGARSDSGYSATELRVARLVADGLTNREVAERLFVSTKAVEATLTRLYAKIGVRSRTELVRWSMERVEM